MLVTKKNENVLVNLFGKAWKEPERPRPIPIKGIPVMISDEGEIVCIEITRDMPVCGWVGQRGSGKSYAAYSFQDRLMHYVPDLRVCNLSDISDEAYFHSKANPDPHQSEQLKLLNEKPMPLPVVSLVPTTNSMIRPERDHFLMSFPWNEILMNDIHYLELGPNIGPAFRRYVRPYLLNKHFNTFEEIETLPCFEEMPDSIANKISSILYNLWELKLTEQNNTDSLTDIDICRRKDLIYKDGKIDGTRNKKTYNTINALMLGKMYPCVSTGNLLSYDPKIVQRFFHYHLQKLMAHQREDPIYKNLKVIIFIDELQRVVGTYMAVPKTKQIVKSIATVGRTLRMGLLYGTQQYSKVESGIRTNTTHLFAFNMINDEAKTIKSDFDLENYIVNEIISLDKHEMYALTKDRFLVYKPDGSFYFTKKPIKGKCLPCLSWHKPPDKN